MKREKTQWHSIKLWTRTYRRLRRIKTYTGEDLAATMERLVSAEEYRLAAFHQTSMGEEPKLPE